ncbi:DUF543-domain-containing protein [Rhizoclosmatium globosum]|uniref:MICOS complex subunit MIC10 n=1 Tax=Rhizoclosmatium globosum TaxID=329046 RepID=A0A1Y2CWL7_9FUNG|nr:hypothetical protein HDU79_010252 [Rhizoclosmatium sp. JEL0117]ORY51431.1 DUF543-domain-containing protein [Rhizoclosmatium globosum]|eukprot:ORY51431.1 DUF543-domain-containing protein [Rhizoclosmatium globosum]
MSIPTGSQEELSRKMDQCLSNTVISTGLGLSAGIVASVLFFKRKSWPIAFSTGVAVGIASNDCSRSFNPNVTLAHRLQALEGFVPKDVASYIPKDVTSAFEKKN